MAVCEILSVGTELIFGLTQDTNASFLAGALRESGFDLRHRQTCRDDRADLEDALSLALSRSDLVIVTGGLGPTYDDVTRDAVSVVTGRPLRRNSETEERIRAYFHRRGREMRENNLLQAMVPEGAEVLPNDWGTAPGIWLETKGKILVLLPGVPREMTSLLRERVMPRLLGRSGKGSSTRILHLFGITESELDSRIPAVYKNGGDPAAAPFAGKGEVELHLSSFRPTAAEAEEAVETAEKDLLREFSSFCYGRGDDTLEKVLVRRFAENRLTLAAAESCTGGLFSNRVTDVPGASAVWRLGVTTYTEEMKNKVLGVKKEIFSGPGVYSEDCALAMAQGVRKLAESDWGVGITGIAGPGGGTEKDPVGTVYIAVAGPAASHAERYVLGHISDERAFIRHLAVSHAMADVLHQAGLFHLLQEK